MMAKYLCDCRSKQAGQLVPTKVTMEEKCIYCGYYAVHVCRHNRIPRGVRIGGYFKYADLPSLNSYYHKMREEYDKS